MSANIHMLACTHVHMYAGMHTHTHSQLGPQLHRRNPQLLLSASAAIKRPEHRAVWPTTCGQRRAHLRGWQEQTAGHLAC